MLLENAITFFKNIKLTSERYWLDISLMRLYYEIFYHVTILLSLPCQDI